jgi:hypothetical protein
LGPTAPMAAHDTANAEVPPATLHCRRGFVLLEVSLLFTGPP